LAAFCALSFFFAEIYQTCPPETHHTAAAPKEEEGLFLLLLVVEAVVLVVGAGQVAFQQITSRLSV
jgi:hypothetical protein